MTDSLDVFSIHKKTMENYKLFVNSFINIKNPKIKESVENEIGNGRFWPEPLIQFNPSFESGESIESLCKRNVIHSGLSKAFKGYELFKHQVEAISLGANGSDFVVTSGTGSGKSLTFLGTIFDHLFKYKKKKGIKAIIVYPMNALINSQFEEISNYKKNYEDETGKDFPITFAQYTGQEKSDDRDKIREDLPDIILTNYMMLELILTRARESSICSSIYENLKFLVFDELHTYRGRQGSDVALLIRRIKAQSQNEVSCIGTSATMVSGGTISEQKKKVAEVATKIFGSSFNEAQVINESLVRCFDSSGKIPSKQTLQGALNNKINIYGSEEELKNFPLSIWLENSVALDLNGDILIRKSPLPFSKIINKLSEESGVEKDICETKFKELLIWVSNVNSKLEKARYTYLPYKIHQFISQTGSVHASLHDDEEKIITLEPKHHQGSGDDKVPLFPIVFSRISGHEFICVSKDTENNVLKPREFRETLSDEEDETQTAGFLIVGDDVWNPETDYEHLPETWVKFNRNGEVKVEKRHRHRMPQKIYFDKQGNFSERANHPYEGWFMTSSLLFDPTCGGQYSPGTSEGTMLTKLGSEARSTSTTALSSSILKELSAIGLPYKEQKLLSFTDNRQDAALQAGHFNDTTKVVHLRAGIYKALSEKKELDFSNFAQSIFDALSLLPEEFADNPSSFPGPKKDNEETFKDFLMYRALFDLRRGWRIVLPNLEQCALLEIHYKHLKENCEAEEVWEQIPLLNILTHSERIDFVFQTLDFFRKAYALYSEGYLTGDTISTKEKQIKERLKPPWKFDERENITIPCKLAYEPVTRERDTYPQSLGPTSTLGKYIKSEFKKKGLPLQGKDAYLDFIKELLDLFKQAGWLKEFTGRNRDNEETKLYQLRVDQIIWKLGDGENIIPDKVKIRTYKEYKQKPNTFYQSLYKTDFSTQKRIIGKEHTGQLSNEDRIEREEKFRSGEYSVLFCSPTMELGIDIANLNIVHLRNVPPNPANYAQRSGRAGRSGQAALVFTNCSVYSPHDRHYFNRQSHMVAGAVSPPKIDVTNRDLLISHLNALCLSYVKIPELNTSLLELVTKEKGLPLNQDVLEKLSFTDAQRTAIITIFKKVIADIKQANPSLSWLNDEWIATTIHQTKESFNKSIDRWRHLYLSAQMQLNAAQEVIAQGQFLRNSPEMKEANRNVALAIRQRELLQNDKSGGGFSEFYPYRYFASEGFLPGYNFTRLPIRTFIPVGNSGEYLSRPRFIALREFGPQNIIYHNGAKFQVEQLLVPEADLRLEKVKVSKNCGYALMGDEYDKDVCPFSGVSLSSPDSSELYIDLLEMSETRTKELAKISCEEEERVSRGFDIKTFFSIPSGGLDSLTTATVKHEDEELLKIRFIPTAKLLKINRKWNIKKEEGFLLGLNSGRWKKEQPAREPTEEERRVKLFTYDTADALYIEPIKSLALDSSGVITLLFALKRAIENIFQVESNEIGVELMGDEENSNIFLYEASEGSLGILSQFIQDKDVFKQIVDEAINICRYDDDEYIDEASYDDLLSYYNQRYHEVINRFAIKDALEKLKICTLEIKTNESYQDYETHYKELRKQVDPNSSTEYRFLDYLYKNGLRLPDSAQKCVDEMYCQPDFFYKPDIWVFCDGTPHDKPEIIEKDKRQREAIINRGDQVFVYYYTDSLEEIVAKRSDIFIKVK